MTTVQQPLDGMPEPPQPDFEAWVDQVRPAFERAAASGREFASWHIKVADNLPDPPRPQSQWGALMNRLHEEGLVRQVGWTATRDGSGVRTWRGTRQARRAVA